MSTGWLSGADVSMKEYLFFSRQYFESRLRSHISPIGIPKQLRRYWCSTAQALVSRQDADAYRQPTKLVQSSFSTIGSHRREPLECL